MMNDNRIPKVIENFHYGDETRWWIGTVVNNADPEFLGRVQVRIYGIHSQDLDKMPTRVLPWAQCLIPSTEGGVSGIGQHAAILPGAQVFGVFLDGKNSQIPFVFGSIHHKETGPMNFDVNDIEARQQDRIFDPRGPHQIPMTSPENSSAEIDTSLVGSTNAEKIYNFFTARGFTPAQASGIIGNFYGESTLNPKANNPNDKGAAAYGLAQWRASRRNTLLDWTAENNLPYDSLVGQLNFVMFELATTETRAAGKLRLSTTPKEATIAFCRYYERPEFTIVNGVYDSPNLQVRIDSAVDAYRRFAT